MWIWIATFISFIFLNMDCINSDKGVTIYKLSEVYERILIPLWDVVAIKKRKMHSLSSSSLKNVEDKSWLLVLGKKKNIISLSLLQKCRTQREMHHQK